MARFTLLRERLAEGGELNHLRDDVGRLMDDYDRLVRVVSDMAELMEGLCLPYAGGRTDKLLDDARALKDNS